MECCAHSSHDHLFPNSLVTGRRPSRSGLLTFPWASCTSLPNWWCTQSGETQEYIRGGRSAQVSLDSHPWSCEKVVSITLFLLWGLCYPAAPFRASLHPSGAFNNYVLVGPWGTKHRRVTCGRKRQTETTGIPAANDQRKRTLEAGSCTGQNGERNPIPIGRE